MTVPTLNADISNPRSAHLYAMYDNSHSMVCRVHARNRDHATRIAERAGYQVGSVNMEG